MSAAATAGGTSIAFVALALLLDMHIEGGMDER